MRKVPILTVIGMLALCAFATSASAGTCAAQDGPDVVLAPGATGDAAAIDLSDFLCGDAQVSGAISAGGVPVGGDTAGASDYSATDGSVTVSGVVQISDFIIGNAPAIGNNNRIAGVAGGNRFLNGIVPGGSFSSMVALTGLPSGGAAGTGAAGTGAAALLTSVAQVTLQDCDGCGDCCVMRARSADLVDGSGLTPVLNADGTYSVAAAADFSGAYIVTLGARSGDSADAVQLLAAQTVRMDMANVLTVPAGSGGSATVANGVVTAAAGQGVLVVSNVPVAVGGLCTVSLSYNTNSAAVNIAVIGFDGGLDGSVVNYSNPTAGNLQTGVSKRLAVSFASQSGSVLPAFQVYNGGANAATVTISNVQVMMAGPLTDYALDVNASADIGDAYLADLLQQEAVAPVVDGCSVTLNGEGVDQLSNASLAIPVPKGSYAMECYVQRSGDAGAGVFVLTLVDAGGTASAASFVSAASIPTDSAVKVTCSIDLSIDLAQAFLVVQSAGANVTVTNLCLRKLADSSAWCDLSLLP